MKFIMSFMILAVLAITRLSGSESEEWWRCPRDADYARQEMFRQFGNIPESSIIYFQISGIPVKRASLGWKTFNPLTYHYRTFDFLHNALVYQSDY